MVDASTTSLPVLGDAIPRRGNRISSAVGRYLLRLAGWRFEGSVPNIPRFVLIVAPHTSNWDFLLGITVMFALRLQVSWMAKSSVFRGPLGVVMRWLGGIPIDRSSRHGVVTQIIQEFNRRAQFILAITPEGTRRPVDRWRTGFYHIAHGAGVPILPLAFDFRLKVISIGKPFFPTGDVDADLQALRSFYTGVTGRRIRRH
jgi:1-acyl-sn-glycerol-3-phosphate acyltransferase